MPAFEDVILKKQWVPTHMVRIMQFNSIYFVFDRSKGVVNPQDIEHVNI